MDFFIKNVYAITPQGGEGGESIFIQFIPFILIIFIFYFLIIRPQQKKTKVHRQMVNSLEKGDEVVTTTGLFGSIVKIDIEKRQVQLEIADKVIIRIVQEHIAEVIKKKRIKVENKEEKKSTKTKKNEVKSSSKPDIKVANTAKKKGKPEVPQKKSIEDEKI